MFDYAFESHGVVSGYAQNAMRKAVLGVVFPNANLAESEELLVRLREQWRARLTVLRQAGWDAVESPKDFSYARNCPPFGIETVDSARACRRRCCPFCWARDHTSPIYNRAHAMCFEPDGRQRAVRLVFFRYTFEWSRNTSQKQAREVFAKDRRSELDLLPDSLGAFVNQTVEPFPKLLKFTRVTLAVVPQSRPEVEWAFPVDPDIKLEVWEPENKGLAEFTKVIATASRYPWRLLRCPVKDLLGVMNLTSKLHMSSYFGKMRGFVRT